MADKNDIVMINLDRPRVLWFGHRALKTLTSMTGKKLGDFMISEDNIDFEDLEKILYCGLLKDVKQNDETLELEDMEGLLDLLPFGEIVGAMQKAFAASFGDIDDEQLKNEQRIAAARKKKK